MQRVYVEVPALKADLVVYGFTYGEDPTELFETLRSRRGLPEGTKMAVREPDYVGGGSPIPRELVKEKVEFV